MQILRRGEPGDKRAHRQMLHILIWAWNTPDLLSGSAALEPTASRRPAGRWKGAAVWFSTSERRDPPASASVGWRRRPLHSCCLGPKRVPHLAAWPTVRLSVWLPASGGRGGGSAEAWRMLEMCIFNRSLSQMSLPSSKSASSLIPPKWLQLGWNIDSCKNSDAYPLRFWIDSSSFKINFD